MTNTLPKDLHRLVNLSSSWRKILLIVAIPALIVGAVFAAQGRILPTLISFSLCVLFGYLALKPKQAHKNKTVRLLAERPDEVTRVSVIRQSGFGVKSAQLHIFADKKGPESVLLIDDVRHLDEALSIVGHYAPQAAVDREEMRARL